MMLKIEPERPIRFRPIFQMLYWGTNYADNCPGVQYFPTYQNWLRSEVIDLGCGTGNVVELLRNMGYDADGVDFVSLPNGMLRGDITKEMNLSMYNTAICLDVVEHLTDDQLTGLIANMKQVRRQVFIVHTGRQIISFGSRTIDLRINIKSRDEWYKLISNHFRVTKIETLGLVAHRNSQRPVISPIDLKQYLFLTETI